MNKKEVEKLQKKASAFVDSIDLNSLRRHGIYVDPFNYDYITGYPLSIYIKPTPVIREPFSLESNETVLTDVPAAYINIPFCSGSCTFCYFVKYCSNPRELEEDIFNYLKALEQEIILWKERFGLQKIHSLYVGGGTPAIMSERNIGFLFEDIIFKHFELPADVEITFEGHPSDFRDFPQSKLELLGKLGVNRISIGTQSLKDSILHEINRRHTSLDTKHAIDAIAHYFKNFNVDFMYGFPHQSVKDILNDIERAVKWNIPSLTFYRLEIHRETPIWKVSKREFPSAHKILIMKQIIREKMETEGYLQDSIDWFIKDKSFTFRQQHFKWSNNYYVGFGMGAYGFLNNTTYSNATTFIQYYNCIDKLRLPLIKTYKLSVDDLMRREMVFAMKLTEGLDIEQFKNRHKTEPEFYFRKEIETLSNLGLLDVANNKIMLTDLGRLFSDQVAEFFYSDSIKQLIKRYRDSNTEKALREPEYKEVQIWNNI
jgi:oxygen-independent coproporphyrinogen-3 oxidase